MSLSWVEATRLASKGGPADRLRRWLIAACAALAAMIAAAAATIPSQQGGDVPNSSVLGQLLTDGSIAPGLMTALAVLSLPVVHLAVQAVRVGAPARDRRLSGMRAAGATLADVRRVVRAEVAAWCSLGAVVGLAGYYGFVWSAPHLIRVRYADLHEDAMTERVVEVGGTLPVIGLDVWPHPLVVAGAAALVPLIGAALVPLVVRREPSRGASRAGGRQGTSPGLAGAYLASMAIATGSVLVMIFAPVDGDTPAGELADWVFIPMLLGTFGLLLCTLVVFASSTSARLGKVLVRRGGAVGMLAGRMMQAHPGLASRAAVSMVLVGFVGGIAIPLQGIFEAEYLTMRWQGGGPTISGDGVASSDVLYYTVPIMAVQVLALVSGVIAAIGLLVAVAEQISLRGADLARQVAVGVPRGVVRRALVVEAAAPMTVMASAAWAIGVAIPVLSVSMTGNAQLLGRISWERPFLFWLVLVAGAVLASWLGSLTLARAAEPRRIRDRE